MNNSKKGWRGDSEGHKRVGSLGGKATAQSQDDGFYSKIGQKGGQISPGNFKNNPERAREAGRKGGLGKKPLTV